VDDPFGKLAKYGDALMIETPGGPDGRAVPAVRRKQSHLKAGSGPYAVSAHGVPTALR
jgi:hypothetical protein